MKKVIFDGSCYNYLMSVNGFTCGFNMPQALSGDQTFGLPPYAKRMPYLVDKYPACPSEWMRSEGKIKSYFIPVIEGRGMWLDFNENESKPNHVAVVISVQGINPITGMPCKDAQLEQYIEECPKHKIKFGADRYCKKCDYKWPKQNYLSTTGTPNGSFWLDGFRSIDGIVRQYILTAEKMKGVASNIIGKDRVFAIGLSFFTSKEKKQVQPKNDIRSILIANPLTSYTPPNKGTGVNEAYWYYSSGGSTMDNNTINDNSTHATLSCLSTKDWMPYSGETKKSYSNTDGTYADTKGSFTQCSVPNVNAKSVLRSSVRTKKLEVAAGAKINQSIYDDPEKLEFWHNEADGIIVINYATEEDVRKIVEQGEVNVDGHSEGFLKDIPVGN